MVFYESMQKKIKCHFFRLVKGKKAQFYKSNVGGAMNSFVFHGLKKLSDLYLPEIRFLMQALARGNSKNFAST